MHGANLVPMPYMDGAIDGKAIHGRIWTGVFYPFLGRTWTGVGHGGSGIFRVGLEVLVVVTTVDVLILAGFG